MRNSSDREQYEPTANGIVSIDASVSTVDAKTFTVAALLLRRVNAATAQNFGEKHAATFSSDACEHVTGAIHCLSCLHQASDGCPVV
jgi:hypothetical protein